MKDALSRAFGASTDMGHSYVGPEHLLIGLAASFGGQLVASLAMPRLTYPKGHVYIAILAACWVVFAHDFRGKNNAGYPP